MKQSPNIAEPSLSLEKVSVDFGSYTAVEDVSFDLVSGEILALVGPNGAGKSTILNAISKIVKPTRGTIRCSCSESIAYVTQKSENRRWIPIKAIDVVKMGLYSESGFWKSISKDAKKRLNYYAEELGVNEFANKQYWNLSGGQKQRVRLAQALVQEPSLLLLDEPFNGLDITNQNILLEAITRQADKGTMVVLTTHNLDLANHCQKLALISKKIIAYGETKDVLSTTNLQKTFGGHVITDINDPSRQHLIVEEHHH